MPEHAKSEGHVAFVGEYEFFTLTEGDLYWARISQPVAGEGHRAGQFYTRAGGIEFALRMARLAAGELERS